MANGIIRLDQGWRLDEGHRLDLPPNIPAPVTSPKKRRHTRSTSKSNPIIMADFIPSKREQRKACLQNIVTKAAAQVVAGGGTAAAATSLTTAADAIIAAYDATDAAKRPTMGNEPWRLTRKPPSWRPSASFWPH